MSSRVRVSSREWMSALERTVRGMLATFLYSMNCREWAGEAVQVSGGQD